ncbi:MAG TPA: hypothetical protein VFI73_04015 [Candidatus Nitrosopolaris sp.]|nr:hypothetical protein [Candidatus Nitrosopolaris sp.]
MEYENIKSIDQQRKRLLQIHDKMEELAPLSFAERHSKQDNRLPLDRIRGLAAEKYLRIVMALSE